MFVLQQIYPVQPWNSNQALLINITEFAKSSRSGAKEVSPRQGAEVDAKQLQPVLEQLGFEVTLCLNKRKVVSNFYQLLSDVLQ